MKCKSPLKRKLFEKRILLKSKRVTSHDNSAATQCFCTNATRLDTKTGELHQLALNENGVRRGITKTW